MHLIQKRNSFVDGVHPAPEMELDPSLHLINLSHRIARLTYELMIGLHIKVLSK